MPLIRNIITATVLAWCVNVPAATFTDDFETGTFSKWDRQYMCCDHSGAVVTVAGGHPVRNGTYAARFEVRITDNLIYNGIRSEVSKMYAPRPEYGTEHWYGWSWFFPEPWENDYEPEIVIQWHGTPDPGTVEISRSPPISFWTDRSGDLYLVRNSDSKPVSDGNNLDSKRIRVGPIPVGEWSDWVMQVRWSYLDDGFINVWRNGTKVIADTGPNCFNDEQGPYLQMGIYKWRWARDGQQSTTTQRVLYFDEVRMRGPGGSYADVAPQGDGGSTGTTDTTPPTVAGVTTGISGTSVDVTFSEAVSSATAEDTDNYGISGGISVTGAVLQSDNRTVALTTSAMSSGSEYTLTVDNVTDRADPANAVAAGTQKAFTFEPCINASDGWEGIPFTAPGARYAVTYRVTPRTVPCNALFTLSEQAADDFADCAVLVRLNSEGKMDVRNGSTYEADADIAYVADSTYTFTVSVTPASHTYDVTVAAGGTPPVTLASGYAFRTEQATAADLAYWNVFEDLGTHDVCSVAFEELAVSGLGSVPGERMCGRAVIPVRCSITGAAAGDGNGIIVEYDAATGRLTKKLRLTH